MEHKDLCAEDVLAELGDTTVGVHETVALSNALHVLNSAEGRVALDKVLRVHPGGGSLLELLGTVPVTGRVAVEGVAAVLGDPDGLGGVSLLVVVGDVVLEADEVVAFVLSRVEEDVVVVERVEVGRAVVVGATGVLTGLLELVDPVGVGLARCTRCGTETLAVLGTGGEVVLEPDGSTPWVAGVNVGLATYFGLVEEENVLDTTTASPNVVHLVLELSWEPRRVVAPAVWVAVGTPEHGSKVEALASGEGSLLPSVVPLDTRSEEGADVDTRVGPSETDLATAGVDGRRGRRLDLVVLGRRLALLGRLLLTLAFLGRLLSVLGRSLALLVLLRSVLLRSIALGSALLRSGLVTTLSRGLGSGRGSLAGRSGRGSRSGTDTALGAVGTLHDLVAGLGLSTAALDRHVVATVAVESTGVTSDIVRLGSNLHVSTAV